jgi:hypothetical protein
MRNPQFSERFGWGYKSKLEILENACLINERNIQTEFKEKIAAFLTPNYQKTSKSRRPGAPRSTSIFMISYFRRLLD